MVDEKVYTQKDIDDMGIAVQCMNAVYGKGVKDGIGATMIGFACGIVTTVGTYCICDFFDKLKKKRTKKFIEEAERVKDSIDVLYEKMNNASVEEEKEEAD